jgi:DNA replication factor GINS
MSDMYEEIYRIWKNEMEKATLEELPADFYGKVAEYLRKIKEELRMLDKKAVRATLLQTEVQNVKHMLQQLLKKRREKIVKKAFRGEKIPQNLLTEEERNAHQKIAPLLENLQEISRRLLEGQYLTATSEKEQKVAVLRFLKDVPAIIGKDMKAYGPFKAEDVASLPIENARILIKQGLAEKVNVDLKP